MRNFLKFKLVKKDKEKKKKNVEMEKCNETNVHAKLKFVQEITKRFVPDVSLFFIISLAGR